MNWFYNLKIRAKLILGFAIITLLTIIMGIIAIINIRSINEDYTSLYDNYGVVLGDLTKVSTSFQRVRINGLYCIVYMDNPELFNYRKNRVKEIKELIQKELKDYEKGILTKEEKDLFNEFIGIYNKYSEMQEEYIQLAEQGRKEEAFKTMTGTASFATKADEVVTKLIIILQPARALNKV